MHDHKLMKVLWSGHWNNREYYAKLSADGATSTYSKQPAIFAAIVRNPDAYFYLFVSIRDLKCFKVSLFMCQLFLFKF